MGFLDQLTSLIKLEANGLKKFEIHIFKNVKVGPLITIDNRRVEINTATATPEDHAEIGEFVRKQIFEEERLLLDSSAQQTLEHFSKIDQTPEAIEILSYFRGKIPDSDIPILRAALYLKTVYEEGGKTHALKEDILLRYGKRGGIIANLCSAGYFISLIRPLYEELSKREDFTLEKFNVAYNTIIAEYVFAVFINNMMTYEQVKTEVVRKIELNRKYGIHKMNLHAIGRENKDKILRLLNDEDLKKILSSTIDMDMFTTSSYVTTTIEF